MTASSSFRRCALFIGLCGLSSSVVADAISIRADEWLPYNGPTVKKPPGYMIELAEKIAVANGELRIEWSRGRDLRDEITRRVVEKDLGLAEMRPFAMNIEDLYLKIVSGGVEQ